MRTRFVAVALAVSATALSQQAHAHGFAGDHLFVSTLLLDDPNVADEASLPTFSYLPHEADDGSQIGQYFAGFELTNGLPKTPALRSTPATCG